MMAALIISCTHKGECWVPTITSSITQTTTLDSPWHPDVGSHGYCNQEWNRDISKLNKEQGRYLFMSPREMTGCTLTLRTISITVEAI